MKEEAAIRAGSGKWSEPGVPHKGWLCVGYTDLGADGPDYDPAICEMCETSSIRFVHHMQHPQYPDQLDCGCICAGHMEGNLKRAKDRDKQMKSRASRRKNFPNRAGWNNNRNGNPQIKIDGGYIIVFKKKNGLWGAVRIRPPFVEGSGVFAEGHFTSADEAKLAAFDKFLSGK